MDLQTLLDDKSVKPKEKTELIGQLLIDQKLSISDLIKFAQFAKDPIKGTCIESIEFATRVDPTIATNECLEFVSSSLLAKAPRVKWESARVIGNIAHLFPESLDSAINNLLVNTEHIGTVVRWSAAFALGAIIQTHTPQKTELITTIRSICEREEKNSIRKIYITAIKRAEK